MPRLVILFQWKLRQEIEYRCVSQGTSRGQVSVLTVAGNKVQDPQYSRRANVTLTSY